MIKINLLPIRAARKKENIRRQVSMYFLCVALGLCVMVYLAISMSSKISQLNQDIESADKDLKKYQAIVQRVTRMKKELQKLREKMDIIVKLDANRTGPVQMMDGLTSVVVPDKMWITSLDEKRGSLKLAGVATDNKTIADFMTYLEESPYFARVDLISSKQVDMKKQGSKFKKFQITCVTTIVAPKKQAKAS